MFGISVVSGIFVIGSLEFTTGSISRSLVCVSQHSLFLGEACLADNRDNAVETNAHTQTHTGETERKSHRGNSQLCAVSEKPACQDVPHSWMNKRGSGSRFPLSDTAGMSLRGKRNRMMEND